MKKNPTHISSDLMRGWLYPFRHGLSLPTPGRDTPQRTHRLRRDTDLLRQFDRNRLQIPLQGIITPPKIAIYYKKLLKIYISEIYV